MENRRPGTPRSRFNQLFSENKQQNVRFEPSGTSENTICEGKSPAKWIPEKWWALVESDLPSEWRRQNRYRELVVLFSEVVERIIPDETIEVEAFGPVYGNMHSPRFGNFRWEVLWILIQRYRETWTTLDQVKGVAERLCLQYRNQRVLYKKVCMHYPLDATPFDHRWEAFDPWPRKRRLAGLIKPKNDSMEAREEFENLDPKDPRRVMRQRWTERPSGRSTDLIDAVYQFGDCVEVPTIIWRAFCNARNWADRKRRMLDKQYPPSPFRAEAILIPRDKYEQIKGKRGRVYELWSAGLTTNQIATEIGLGPRQIRRIIKCFKPKSDQTSERSSKRKLATSAFIRKRSLIRSSRPGF